MAKYNVWNHCSRNEGPPAAGKEIWVEPPFLYGKIFFNVAKQGWFPSGGRTIVTQRGIGEDVLELERD